MPGKSTDEKSGWNLYWVTSDGEEDCFVVARNSRSAARVEVDYCGFDRGDVAAIRVKSVPKPILQRWEAHRRKEGYKLSLPWYADQWLLKRLGATFRKRGFISETLIDEVVYTNDPNGPVRPRSIGRRFVAEFKAMKAFQRYGHEDRYSKSQVALFTILGICVARVQEIEHLIAHSFIFGAINKSERRRNQTIAELVERWKRKTLGQMLRIIEEDWEIEPTVYDGLQLFLSMRNYLVHSLTTSEQYDISTTWGQDETVGFLTWFELVPRHLREAFRGSLYASIEIGNEHFAKDDPERRCPLTSRQRKKISLFTASFTPRQEEEQDNPEDL